MDTASPETQLRELLAGFKEDFGAGTKEGIEFVVRKSHGTARSWLASPDLEVRIAAAYGLMHAGDTDPDVLSELRRGLSSASVLARLLSLYALADLPKPEWRLTSNDVQLVADAVHDNAVLISSTRQCSPPVGIVAAETLARLGAAAKPHILAGIRGDDLVVQSRMLTGALTNRDPDLEAAYAAYIQRRKASIAFLQRTTGADERSRTGECPNRFIPVPLPACTGLPGAPLPTPTATPAPQLSTTLRLLKEKAPAGDRILLSLEIANGRDSDEQYTSIDWPGHYLKLSDPAGRIIALPAPFNQSVVAPVTIGSRSTSFAFKDFDLSAAVLTKRGRYSVQFIGQEIEFSGPDFPTLQTVRLAPSNRIEFDVGD